MTNAMQVGMGGVSPLLAPLLSPLTPLLVTTLTTQGDKLAKITLKFWALTFDRQEGVCCAPELVNAFCTYSKTNHIADELRLVGMGVFRWDDVAAESVTTVSDSDVTAINETQPDDTCCLEPISKPGTDVQDSCRPDDEVAMIVSHSSPLRGTQSPYRRSGFIDHASPHRLHPSPRKAYPISPNAREVAGLSPYLSAPMAIAGEKLELVCKRLSLNKDNSQIVS